MKRDMLVTRDVGIRQPAGTTKEQARSAVCADDQAAGALVNILRLAKHARTTASFCQACDNVMHRLRHGALPGACAAHSGCTPT